jgi:hypothetical protein
MAYSLDYKKRVVAYKREEHTHLQLYQSIPEMKSPPAAVPP